VKISTRGRYAIRALIYLVNHMDKGPVSLQDISENENISITYLGQIFFHLKQFNIVKSVRGPGGGYLLARDPEDIKLSEIVKAAEESINVSECVEHPEECDRSANCLTRILWLYLNRLIMNFFDTITLADLKDTDIVGLTRKLAEKLGKMQIS